MAIERRDIPMTRRSFNYSMRREPIGSDKWQFDAPFYVTGGKGSYDRFFAPLLQEEGVDTFSGLLEARGRAGLSRHVLELFGSGYFIEDFTTVDTVTGVRLLDASLATIEELQEVMGDIHDRDPLLRISRAISRIEEVTASPKWSLVEGNPFKPDTWGKLDSSRKKREIPSFGVTVIKPEAAFEEAEIFHPFDYANLVSDPDHINKIYSLKFLKLLNRAYRRSSSHDGMIFAQVPPFIAYNFLDAFRETLAHGGIRTGIMNTTGILDTKNMKLVKNQDSVPDLEQLVHQHPIF